jgi:uncharacterized membrane protein YgdD (TMEM256/DUF423 family)
MMNDNSARSWWTLIGAVSAAIAVGTGAYAAHGLPELLQDFYGDTKKEWHGEEILAWKKYLADFKTAAEYQMYHALGLIALGSLRSVRCRKSTKVAGWSLLLGTIMFSGSLYVLALTHWTWLGMIVTPIGGILFIVGWVAFAFAVCPCSSKSCSTADTTESGM